MFERQPGMVCNKYLLVNDPSGNTKLEEIETKGGEFKISNDYICFYARLFHARYPQHNDFFKLKPLKEEKEIEYYKSKGYNKVTRLFG